MEAAGLPGEWWKQYSVDPTYCLTKIQRKMKQKRGKSRLTLTNLSGAFLVLGIGYILAVMAFVFEHWKAAQSKKLYSSTFNVINPLSVEPSSSNVIVDEVSSASGTDVALEEANDVNIAIENVSATATTHDSLITVTPDFSL